VSRAAIVAGLDASIARRTVAMITSLRPERPVVFTGGVSQNEEIAKLLMQDLGHPVIVPHDAVYKGHPE